jgi:hypothetical protein
MTNGSPGAAGRKPRAPPNPPRDRASQRVLLRYPFCAPLPSARYRNRLLRQRELAIHRGGDRGLRVPAASRLTGDLRQPLQESGARSLGEADSSVADGGTAHRSAHVQRSAAAATEEPRCLRLFRQRCQSPRAEGRRPARRTAARIQFQALLTAESRESRLHGPACQSIFREGHAHGGAKCCSAYRFSQSGPTNRSWNRLPR